MKRPPKKGPPIPVRFEADEGAAIRALAEATGLPAADVIRRAVRLLHREVQRRGTGFMTKLTALKNVPKEIEQFRKDDPLVPEEAPRKRA
jgi:hypothetical protein